jgi:hypothetical protein
METADQADRLEASLRAFLDLEAAIDAAGPWPLSEVFGTEPEAVWGPAELLAHVDEALRFWSGEVERALAAPASDEPFPLGRTPEDDTRLRLIARDRLLPIAELLDRVAADGGRVAARLRSLTGEEAARPVVRAGRGAMTVAELVEATITSHLDGHVAQLREIVAGRGAG